MLRSAVKNRIVYTCAALALLLVGCGVLAGPNMPATLQAENQSIVAQATSIAAASARDRDRVRATAVAAMTQVAEIHQANQVLLTTVDSGQSSNSTTIIMDTRHAELTPGQPWFVLTGLSSFVDDSGCVVSPQITFTSDAPVIYATMVGHNAHGGIELSVSWEYEGAQVHQESFTMSSNAPEQCLWFSIDPSSVDMLTGDWIVRFYADGTQVGTPMAFAVRPADAAMQGG